MERFIEFLGKVPIAAWVIVLAAGFFVVEYAVLHLRQGRSAVRARESERRLVLVATALRSYADRNGQRLPTDLDELNLPEVRVVAYRRVPRLDLDEKLILVHDHEPTHKVLEFPVLRDGRALIFCSGRMRVVSEEVFEKLIAADAALRGRLGIDAEAADGEENLERAT